MAQAIGQSAIQQGYRVLYRETHALLDDLAEATLDGTRKEHMEFLQAVPLPIIDDLGMRKLPLTAAEELLEIIMRRYERASTMKQAGLDFLEGYFSTHDRRKRMRAAYAIDLKQFLGFPNWTAFLEQRRSDTCHTGRLTRAWTLPLAPLRV